MSDPEPLGEIALRLSEVRARIDAAAARAGRPAATVRLIAVSKAKRESAIRAAYAAGQRDFGENYVQELVEKSAALSDLAEIRWHFIGKLQRNKARHVVATELVHTVDREELAIELDKRSVAAGRRLGVLIEVNVAGEATKGGCSPDGLGDLLAAVARAPGLEARGLMTIPPESADLEATRAVFVALRGLRDRHRAALGPGELSMGMSHDYDVAIAEGATMVRVGTAIFGARQKT